MIILVAGQDIEKCAAVEFRLLGLGETQLPGNLESLLVTVSPGLVEVHMRDSAQRLQVKLPCPGVARRRRTALGGAIEAARHEMRPSSFLEQSALAHGEQFSALNGDRWLSYAGFCSKRILLFGSR
ncbi:MAG: hypothetical protein VCA35_07625 [Roseibacillus sp.]